MNTKSNNPEELAAALAELREKRKKAKHENRRSGKKRMSLNNTERKEILAKTNNRCHICGGSIEGRWQADHVLAHSAGGKHSVDNYLAAHAVCNNYRWDYTAEEFQLILKLGVLARTQIETKTKVGTAIASAFLAKERQRIKRRRSSA